MTSVNNYMWISTSEQKLYIIHTPSMKTTTSVSLNNADKNVIHLLHVIEWHVVVVMWTGPEIWYIQDKVDHTGIAVLDKQKLSSPLLHWCEVAFQDRVEVWGTQEDGKIVILDWSRMGQRTNVLSPSMVNCSRKLTCECIANSQMESNDGGLSDQLVQVWVSFKQDTQLMCWDATTRTPFYSVKIPTKGETCENFC